jgi:uncharacterized protein YndB with AHSA1/START domain
MTSWWPLETHSRAVDEERQGVSALGVLVESHPGGRIMERLSNGEQLPWGEILAWESPARLLIAWKPNNSPYPPTELQITFSAADRGTRVVLEHRGWERLGDAAAQARAGYAKGWRMVFAERYAKAANRAAS